MSDPYVLILYYSRTQGTQNLALHMARGVDQVTGIEPRIRTVPPVSAVTERTAPSVPDDGAVFCTKEDLIHCSGLALGSATRFGNMAAPLKYFLDTTADLWAGHHLVGKPASVFLLYWLDARRSGKYTADHDGTVAASRHADPRPALQFTRSQSHPKWGYALWR